MATELKTKKNSASVKEFLDRVEPARRAECKKVSALMSRVTGAKPKMWGTSIVGFGEYAYKYPSGQSGTWPLTGFSPRKQALTLYVMAGFDRFSPLLKKLGSFKTGKSCLYLRSLDDVDLKALEQLVKASVSWTRKNAES